MDSSADTSTRGQTTAKEAALQREATPRSSAAAKEAATQMRKEVARTRVTTEEDVDVDVGEADVDEAEATP